MARAVARGGRRPPGALVLLLVGFLVVATGVIWRRSAGLARAREQAALERKREGLIAQQRRLESEVRDARSRKRLAPLVEQRLGMRVPSASQLIYLQRQAPASRPDDSP